MSRNIDHDRIEALYRELYDPFMDPESALRSNYCIADGGKIFLAEEVQNLGSITNSSVELKVQIYNTSTKEALIESVRLSPERGKIRRIDLPGFSVPPLDYYMFTHRIAVDSLVPDFYTLILTFFVKGENSEKIKVNFSIPDTSSQINDPDKEVTNETSQTLPDNYSDLVLINSKKENFRITFPRGNAVGSFRVSSDYDDSRYLLATFENNTKVTIPPSGKDFSTKDPAVLRNHFQLRDDKGRFVNTISNCEIIVDRDLNIYHKVISSDSLYRFYLKGFSSELRVGRKSDHLNIQNLNQIKKKLHQIVFSRSLSGDAFVYFRDKKKEFRVDIEFEDDIPPVRVLEIATIAEGVVSQEHDNIHFKIPLKVEGIGELRVLVNEDQIEHSGEIVSRIIDPWNHVYDLKIPVSFFDLNGHFNLRIGFVGEDDSSIWYNVLCKYVLKGRLFDDLQIGPVILSYGNVVEKQVKLNLAPGEKLIKIQVGISGDGSNTRLSLNQNERVYFYLNDTIEYSYFDDYLVFRFNCSTPFLNFLTKWDISVSVNTDKSTYIEHLSILIYYYEVKGNFITKDVKGHKLLDCINSGEEQMIIYRIGANHPLIKIDHLFNDVNFPVIVEPKKSKSFIIFGLDKIQKEVEVSIFYNNPNPEIITIKV